MKNFFEILLTFPIILSIIIAILGYGYQFFKANNGNDKKKHLTHMAITLAVLIVILIVGEVFISKIKIF